MPQGDLTRSSGAAWEDVNLGLRGRLSGYGCTFVPTAVVLHKGHGLALPNRTYVSLVTRNRLMLFRKDIPLRLLVHHLPSLIGQLVLFIQYAARSPRSRDISHLSGSCPT